MENIAIMRIKNIQQVIINTLFLLLTIVIYSHANEYDSTTNLESINRDIISSAKRILHNKLESIEPYDIEIRTTTDNKFGGNCVVMFTPKVSTEIIDKNNPSKVIITVKPVYSVYFKRENNKFKYLGVVKDQ